VGLDSALKSFYFNFERRYQGLKQSEGKQEEKQSSKGNTVQVYELATCRI